MSQFTTGELAKQCDITVRTVQFYDAKGLLTPSAFTEGGRRLYSDDDLKQMRLIVMLKKIGLSLDSILGILKSDSPDKVLLLLLDQQQKQIDAQVSDMLAQKHAVKEIQKCIRQSMTIPVNSIRDIEQLMKNTKTLRKTYATLLIVGIFMDILQIGAVLLWIFRGNWIPFVVLMPFVVLTAAILVRFYFNRTAYVCPECGTTFKPSRKEAFFAKHTLKTRKLTCTNCGHHGFCVEVASPE